MKEIEIYTAISCKGSVPQTGGLGVIVKYKYIEKEVSHGLTETKSSRMEILSVIKGLEILKEPCFVTAYLNNQNLIDTYEKGWIDRWIKKGLLSRENNKVKNKDLHIELLGLIDKHQVRFVRYDTLTTISGQQKRAKTLALQYADRTDLQPDTIKPLDSLEIQFDFQDYTEDDLKEIQREKSARGAWHSRHIKEVTNIFDNTCQMCGCNPPDKKGVAHHLSYPKDYWLIPLDQKVKEGIITFVCKDCHQKSHTADTYQEYKDDKLKHSGYCTVCNDFAPKMWKRYHPDNFPFALCKPCLKDLKEGRLTITKNKKHDALT